MMSNSTKSIINLLGGLKVVIPVALLIFALITYWISATKDVEAPIEVIDYTELNSLATSQTTSVTASLNDSQSLTNKSVAKNTVDELPAPAKKLTLLLKEPLASSQENSDIEVNQAIDNANQTMADLDQQLSALGYHPEIADIETNLNSITNPPDPALTERFEKLKSIIQ